MCAMTCRIFCKSQSLTGRSKYNDCFVLKIDHAISLYIEAKPTPSMANSRLMSQKRCTTCISDQPFSWK